MNTSSVLPSNVLFFHDDIDSQEASESTGTALIPNKASYEMARGIFHTHSDEIAQGEFQLELSERTPEHRIQLLSALITPNPIITHFNIHTVHRTLLASENASKMLQEIAAQSPPDFIMALIDRYNLSLKNIIDSTSTPEIGCLRKIVSLPFSDLIRQTPHPLLRKRRACVYILQNSSRLPSGFYVKGEKLLQTEELKSYQLLPYPPHPSAHIITLYKRQITKLYSPSIVPNKFAELKNHIRYTEYLNAHGVPYIANGARVRIFNAIDETNVNYRWITKPTQQQSLEDYLSSEKNQTTKILVCQKITEAVAGMHRLGVFHNNLSYTAIGVHEENPIIGTFGLATRLDLVEPVEYTFKRTSIHLAGTAQHVTHEPIHTADITFLGDLLFRITFGYSLLKRFNRNARMNTHGFPIELQEFLKDLLRPDECAVHRWIYTIFINEIQNDHASDEIHRLFLSPDVQNIPPPHLPQCTLYTPDIHFLNAETPATLFIQDPHLGKPIAYLARRFHRQGATAHAPTTLEYSLNQPQELFSEYIDQRWRMERVCATIQATTAPIFVYPERAIKEQILLAENPIQPFQEMAINLPSSTMRHLAFQISSQVFNCIEGSIWKIKSLVQPFCQKEERASFPSSIYFVGIDNNPSCIFQCDEIQHDPETRIYVLRQMNASSAAHVTPRKYELIRGPSSVLPQHYPMVTFSTSILQKEAQITNYLISKNVPYIRKTAVLEYHRNNKPNETVFLTESNSLCSLNEFLIEEHNYVSRLHIAKQLTLAIQKMHEQGVYHNNITKNSVKIVKGPEGTEIRLAEFTHAECSQLPTAQINPFSSEIRPPECFNGTTYIPFLPWTDLWQLGNLLSLLLFGSSPIEKYHLHTCENPDQYKALLKKMNEEHIAPRYLTVDPSVQLVIRLLSPDPHERPSARIVFKHLLEIYRVLCG